MASAVVIGIDSNMPGKGFWEFAKDLGMPFSDTKIGRETFWLTQFQETINQARKLARK
jgi:hypothetical protein